MSWYKTLFGGVAKGARVINQIQNVPGLGTALSALPGAGIAFAVADQVIHAEEAFASAPGSGPEKAVFVAGQFDKSLAGMQEVAEAMGKKIEYDPEPLQRATDLQVAYLKAVADLKASFRFVDLPKLPAAK